MGTDDEDFEFDGTETESSSTLVSYRETIHPFLVKSCSQCHGDQGVQSPRFAVSDASKSLDSIWGNKGKYLVDPENSRFYRRVKVDRHNCPNNNCSQAADEILRLLRMFKERTGVKEESYNYVTYSQSYNNGEPFYPILKKSEENEDRILLIKAYEGEISNRMELKKNVDKAYGGQALYSPTPFPHKNAHGLWIEDRALSFEPNGTANLMEARRHPDNKDGWQPHLVRVGFFLLDQEKVKKNKTDFNQNFNDHNHIYRTYGLPTYQVKPTWILPEAAEITAYTCLMGKTTNTGGIGSTSDPCDDNKMKIFKNLYQPTSEELKGKLNSQSSYLPELRRNVSELICRNFYEGGYNPRGLYDCLSKKHKTPSELKVRNNLPHYLANYTGGYQRFIEDSKGKNIHDIAYFYFRNNNSSSYKSEDYRSLFPFYGRFLRYISNYDYGGNPTPSSPSDYYQPLVFPYQSILDNNQQYWAKKGGGFGRVNVGNQGKAKLKFKVEEDGDYKFSFRLVNSKSNAHAHSKYRERAFYYKINNQSLTGVKDLEVNGLKENDWFWVGSESVSLTAGKTHELEVSEQRAGFHLNLVGIHKKESQVSYDPGLSNRFAPQGYKRKTLQYDISNLVNQAKTYFKIEVEYDEGSKYYVFTNPRFELNKGNNIYVDSIKILQDGKLRGENTYALTKGVFSSGQKVSYGSMMIDCGDNCSSSNFQFAFKNLRVTNEAALTESDIKYEPYKGLPKCKDLKFFRKAVKPILSEAFLMRNSIYGYRVQNTGANRAGAISMYPYSQYGCVNCHKSTDRYNHPFPFGEFYQGRGDHEDDARLCSLIKSKIAFDLVDQSPLWRGFYGSEGHLKHYFMTKMSFKNGQFEKDSNSYNGYKVEWVSPDWETYTEHDITPPGKKLTDYSDKQQRFLRQFIGTPKRCYMESINYKDGEGESQHLHGYLKTRADLAYEFKEPYDYKVYKTCGSYEKGDDVTIGTTENPWRNRYPRLRNFRVGEDHPYYRYTWEGSGKKCSELDILEHPAYNARVYVYPWQYMGGKYNDLKTDDHYDAHWKSRRNTAFYLKLVNPGYIRGNTPPKDSWYIRKDSKRESVKYCRKEGTSFHCSTKCKSLPTCQSSLETREVDSQTGGPTKEDGEQVSRYYSESHQNTKGSHTTRVCIKNDARTHEEFYHSDKEFGKIRDYYMGIVREWVERERED